MDKFLQIKLNKTMKKKKKNSVGRPPMSPYKKRVMVGFTLPPLMAEWLRDRSDKSLFIEKLLQKEFLRSAFQKEINPPPSDDAK